MYCIPTRNIKAARTGPNKGQLWRRSILWVSRSAVNRSGNCSQTLKPCSNLREPCDSVGFKTELQLIEQGDMAFLPTRFLDSTLKHAARPQT